MPGYPDRLPTVAPNEVDCTAVEQERRDATSLELLKIAAEHFRQDIAAHWTQASFFAVIQAAFISVFATAVGPHDAKGPELVGPELQAVGLACAGLIFAFLWLLMAQGRERYICLWRDQVVRLDRAVERKGVYETVEASARNDPLNPTTLASAIPGIICWGWVTAGAWTLMLAPQHEARMMRLQRAGSLLLIGGSLCVAVGVVLLARKALQQSAKHMRPHQSTFNYVTRFIVKELVLTPRPATAALPGLGFLSAILGAGILLGGGVMPDA